MKRFILSLCLSMTVSFNAFSSQEIHLDGSQDPLLSSLQKIEIVAYNKSGEIVYKHLGESLKENLTLVASDKKIFELMTQDQWAKVELDLRAQISPQLPFNLDEEAKSATLDRIISDIKVKHLSPPISFAVLEKAAPTINEIANNKKILVIYIPKDVCKTCKNDEQLDLVRSLETDFPNMVFIEAIID